MLSDILLIFDHFFPMQVFLDDEAAQQGSATSVADSDASNMSVRPFCPTYDNGGEISDIECVDEDIHTSNADVTCTLEEVVHDLEKLNLNKTLGK